MSHLTSFLGRVPTRGGASRTDPKAPRGVPRTDPKRGADHASRRTLDGGETRSHRARSVLRVLRSSCCAPNRTWRRGFGNLPKQKANLEPAASPRLQSIGPLATKRTEGKDRSCWEMETSIAELIEKLQVQVAELDSDAQGWRVDAAKVENLSELVEKINSLQPNLKEHDRVELWKQCVRLWNVCVSLSNGKEDPEQGAQVTMRYVACLLSDAGGELPGGSLLDTAERTTTFWCKTGELNMKNARYEMAENCLSRATEKSKPLEDAHQLPPDSVRLLLNLYVQRSTCARQMRQSALATGFLAKARKLPGALLPGCSSEEKGVISLLVVDAHITYALEGSDEFTSDPTQIAEVLQPTYEMIERLKYDAIEADDEELLKQILDREQGCLTALAASHMVLENYETAMRCLSILQNSDGMDENETCKIMYMQSKCLAELGELEAADKMLRVMLEKKGFAPEAAYDVLFTFVKKGSLDHVPQLLEVIFDASAEKKQLVASIIVQLLNLDGPAAFTTAAGVLTNKRITNYLKGSDGEECRKIIWTCLWNYAGKHFLGKNFEVSTQAFAACLEYGEDSGKAKTARMAALSCLGMKDVQKAAEYAHLSEEHSPGSLATLFTKLKIVLSGADIDAAAVNQLVQCITHAQDCTESHLRLVCREAIEAKRFDVVLSALEALHNLVQNGNDTMMTEAMILRCALRVADDHMEVDQFARYYKIAAHRLSNVGTMKFMGNVEDKQVSLSWFAHIGWNKALAAGKDELWTNIPDIVDSADVYFEALKSAATLNQSELHELVSRQQMCMLLGAAAVLECHKKGQTGDDDLLRARRFLSTWKDYSSRTQSTDMELHPSKAHVYHCLLEFDLACREKNASALTKVLERAKTITHFTGDSALRMASLTLGDDQYQNKQVAIACLYVALQLFLRAEAPDYSSVAETMRTLIVKKKSTSSKTEEEEVALYREALQIVQGASAKYPQEEIHWLATTSWNQGALHSKFHRPHQAKVWMDIALQFAQRCAVLESKQDAMQKEFQHVMQELGH